MPGQDDSEHYADKIDFLRQQFDRHIKRPEIWGRNLGSV